MMKLSTLSVMLGLAVALPQVVGLVNPAKFRDAVRRFPRHEGIGWVLMILGTSWFVFNLSRETVSDFAQYRSLLMLAFAGVGAATCFFVRDFLAVRGLAVVMLMLAHLMVNTQRWVDTDWRWVIGGWAYLLVVGGMWFTVSPWRLRDLLNWATETDARIRAGSALRLAFGLFVAGLGLTVFRAAEKLSAGS